MVSSRHHSIYIFGAAVILFTGVGFTIDWIYWMYILPMHRIAEETGIIHGVNPAHRIQLKGSGDVVRLADSINTAADRFEELHRSVEERIAESHTRIEEEKNILSVVLAELPEGVVICTAEGQITLYNQRAQQLLEAPDKLVSAADPLPTGGFIGLGRSIFGVVDKPIITHALKDIPEKLRSGQHDLTSSFVMVGAEQPPAAGGGGSDPQSAARAVRVRFDFNGFHGPDGILSKGGFSLPIAIP